MKMQGLGIATACVVILGGCATNLIEGKPYTFYNTATLIDADGRMHEGRIITNAQTQDGTIEIPQTKYGPLSGKFSVQTPSVTSQRSGIGVIQSSDQTILVPSMSAQTITSGNSSGQAYLAAGDQVVLRCNLSVSQRGTFYLIGTTPVYMIGSGVCTDADGKISNLQFTR